LYNFPGDGGHRGPGHCLIWASILADKSAEIVTDPLRIRWREQD
jgi:hypothetical protein